MCMQKPLDSCNALIYEDGTMNITYFEDRSFVTRRSASSAGLSTFRHTRGQTATPAIPITMPSTVHSAASMSPRFGVNPFMVPERSIQDFPESRTKTGWEARSYGYHTQSRVPARGSGISPTIGTASNFCRQSQIRAFYEMSRCFYVQLKVNS
jgi:hypothetical protein